MRFFDAGSCPLCFRSRAACDETDLEAGTASAPVLGGLPVFTADVQSIGSIVDSSGYSSTKRSYALFKQSQLPYMRDKPDSGGLFASLLSFVSC